MKTNIAEKYYKIGLSELCWNFSTICKDGTDMYWFLKAQVMWVIDLMQFSDGGISSKWLIISAIFVYCDPIL